jgi:E3 ubiquitin-protein ligase HERC4
MALPTTLELAAAASGDLAVVAPDSPPSGETASTYLVMDPLDDSPSTLPALMRLKALQDRPVVSAAGSAGRIAVVTHGSELLMAETVVTDDRDPGVAFCPVSQFELLDLSEVACGAEHVVVSAARGGQAVVLAAGNNSMGQLGCGRVVAESSRFKPVKLPAGARVAQLCCGSFFTLALTDVGDVWGFGHNNRGQLGLDARADIVEHPAPCRTLRGVPVCQLAAGSFHSLALSSTGLVFAAGANSQGQLGLWGGDARAFALVGALAPVYVVRVAAFGAHSAAIDEFGSLYLWGSRFGPEPQPRALAGEQFIDVSVGHDGRVAALTDAGRVVVWGLFRDGDEIPPTEIRAGAPFVRVFSGGEYFLAIADQYGKPPLTALSFACGRSIRSSDAEVTTRRLRAQPKTMILSVAILRAGILANPNQAIHVVERLFSSMSVLNGSFLVDNFCECLSSTASGVDVTGIIEMYNGLARDKSLIDAVIPAFNGLLEGVTEHPPTIRIPATLRFILVGLLLPSVASHGPGFQVWQNLVGVIAQLNAYAILIEWLAVVHIDQLDRVLQSVKALLSDLLLHKFGLYSDPVLKTVRAIEILWSASARTQKLAFDAFYEKTVNHIIDLKNEYGLWRQRDSNWSYTANASWLLDAQTKTRFLRMNSRQLMNERQLAAMRNATEFLGDVPLVTPADMFFILIVNRDTLVRDTFQCIALLKNPEIDLKKPLKVGFKGEPGIDEGGVQREFFSLLVNELFNPDRDFFVPHQTFHWFNPKATDPASKQAFFLTGVLFGLAIYNGNLLDVRFPAPLYKKLRGSKLNLEDLSQFDSELSEGLRTILQYDGNVENDIGLTFQHGDTPLCPNGADIPVTNDNREEFCELVIRYVLVDSVAVQFEEFKTGFLESAGTIVLDLFRSEEIALLVAGREELSFTELEMVTTYEGYEANSPAVRTFWNIVHTRLTEDEKRKLLYFTTSCPRAPISGLKSVPFKIGRDGDPAHVPTAHTCNFMLVLPDEPNEEKMFKKLQTAIEHSEGFAFR